MKKTYLLDGKIVTKSSIDKTKFKLVKVVNERHYETDEYSKQQAVNAHRFFNKLSDDRDELNERHG